MKDYGLGAWEALIYAIKFLKENDKDSALEEFKSLKEQLEDKVAKDFYNKVTISSS